MINENKAIIITSSSTGIGKACAPYLDDLGFENKPKSYRLDDIEANKSIS